MMPLAAAAIWPNGAPGKRRIKIVSIFCRSSMATSTSLPRAVNAGEQTADDESHPDQADHNAHREQDHRHAHPETNDHHHEPDEHGHCMLEKSAEPRHH